MKTAKFQPSGDRVLLERQKSSETVRGGIIIPGTAQEKPLEGVIVAVGNGRLHNGRRIPVSFKVGDKVLISKHAGTEIKMEGQEYLIMREEDLLGTILP